MKHLANLIAVLVFALALAGLVIMPANARQAGPGPIGAAAAVGDEPVFTPDSSIKYALSDLAGIPEEYRKYIRYLSMYNLKASDRKKLAQTVSFVVNSLSVKKNIKIPVYVGNSQETVIRINLSDYGIDPKDWDDLGKNGSGIKPIPDPYFHSKAAKIKTQIDAKVAASVTPAKTQKVIKYRIETRFDPRFGGNVQVQVPYEEEVPVTSEQAPPATAATISSTDKGVPGIDAPEKTALVAAAWLDPATNGLLKQGTHSDFPMLRADWFVVNAIQPPAYYKFYKLGDNIKDFEKLVGANVAESILLRGADKAVVTTSSVARNNRTLTRGGTLNGGYIWISHDTLNSVGDRKYMINLLNEKFDATEVLATLPNKLYVWFLTDGAGKRVDFADPNVAIDSTATDKIVRCGRSCMICHSDGIRPIEDRVRKITDVLTDRDQIRLLIPDFNDYQRVIDLFGSNLDKQIVDDAQIYANAVSLATGLTMQKNAQQLGHYYNLYAENTVSIEVAARECGLPLGEFVALIKKRSKDDVVLGLFKGAGMQARRDQWEDSFQEIMLEIINDRLQMAPTKPVMPPTPNWNSGPPVANPEAKDDGPPEANQVRVLTTPGGQVKLKRKNPEPVDVLAFPHKANQEPPPPTKRQTTLVVTVPERESKLIVNKVEIKSTGITRTFKTPLLPDNEEFVYEMHCVTTHGEETTLTSRTVKFKPGDEVKVDLSK